MISFLLACTEPPLLASVGGELGSQAAELATPPLQMFVATVSVVGETCGVGQVESHVFTGGGAQRLSVSSVTVTTDAQGNHVWTFADVGLDASRGSLVVSADSKRTRFSTEWTTPSASFSADLRFADCPESSDDTADDTAGADADHVLVTGNGTWTHGEESSEMVLQGEGETPGLRYEPPAAPSPSVGWIHWKDARNKDVITLNDASAIGSTGWPGVATGTGWTADVTVKAP